jgi:hypothetical protein
LSAWQVKWLFLIYVTGAEFNPAPLLQMVDLKSNHSFNALGIYTFNEIISPGYLALPVVLLTFLSCVSPSSYTMTLTGVATRIFSLTSSSSLSKYDGSKVWVSACVGNHNNVVPISFMNC